MVKRIHLVLDDKDFETLKDLKEEHEMTWEEFVIYASSFIPTFTVSTGVYSDEENSNTN